MKAERDRFIVSLVERGWRGARECSLDLQQHGVCVTHLIKGQLEPSVREIIAPRPNVRLLSVGRRWFWWRAWWQLLRAAGSGRLRSILVDNERATRRLRRWATGARVPLVLVEEGPAGFRLQMDGQEMTRAAWYAALGIDADRPRFR